MNIKDNINNREMALNYIEKVLSWEKFCNTHKKLAQSLRFLLAEIEKTPEAETIKKKIKLNLPLTNRERSYYLLYIADKKERRIFLKKEKENA